MVDLNVNQTLTGLPDARSTLANTTHAFDVLRAAYCASTDVACFGICPNADMSGLGIFDHCLTTVSFSSP